MSEPKFLPKIERLLSEAGIRRKGRIVLHGILEGKSNKEIGDGLLIDENTVKYHVTGLLKRLEATNRTELIIKLARMGHYAQTLDATSGSLPLGFAN